MMRNLVLPVLISVIFLLCFSVRLGLERIAAVRPCSEYSAYPLRIVSLAPSITETLFAVGLGNQVAAVTRFCAYPPKVQNLPKVAGFSDLNVEALLRLRPDLVVTPADKSWNKAQIERLGIPVLALEVRSIEGLIQGVEQLGKLTDNPAPAKALLAEIKQSITPAESRPRSINRLRVLFSVMHTNQGMRRINEISAIGRDGFYDRLIEIAGGRNVYEGSLAYPRLSREAIVFLNPDVIIDVVPAGLSAEALIKKREEWLSFVTVNAVKNNRIFILADEMHTVPGPRFTETLKLLSLAVSSENGIDGKPNLPSIGQKKHHD